MHGPFTLRRGFLLYPRRVLSAPGARSLVGHSAVHLPTSLAIPRPLQQTYRPTLSLDTSLGSRSISSTAPAFKRRGGASALIAKSSRPRSKKSRGKKIIRRHGEPGSRAKTKQRLEEYKKKAAERLAAITPEESAKYQQLASEFIETPSGDQEVGSNQFLRQENPEALMLKLGMPVSFPGPDNDDTLRYADKWKAPPGNHGESPYQTPRASLAEGPLAGGEGSKADGSLVAESSGNMSWRKKKRFTRLIRVLNAHGRFQEARRRVVPEMLKQGVEFDAYTYSAILSGAALDADVVAAEEAWEAMIADGIEPNDHTWSSRIHAYTSAGRMNDAFALGDDMREKGFPWGVVVYTSMIAGCVQIRDFKRAWETYKDMFKWGIEPDVMVYTTLMKMCAHKHEYERAMKFAREMEEMDGIKPTLATMEILFRAAAKAPQWLQAYGKVVDDLIVRMKGLGLKPQEQTYRALMFAYGSGGDVDRVLQCIEEAHELKGQDVRLLGDGTPKLSPSTYCAALNALASCQSVGMRDGTKARWGSLPGQELPGLDITAIPVPRDDVQHLRHLKLQGMEWDEEAESSLRKGQTRRKFGGVTTPEELQGDDEWEAMVESEHRRIMQKAKRLKLEKERKEELQLGIDMDARKSPNQRLRLFPHPRQDEIMKRDLDAWIQMQAGLPGNPETSFIPAELRLPSSPEEMQGSEWKALQSYTPVLGVTFPRKVPELLGIEASKGVGSVESLLRGEQGSEGVLKLTAGDPWDDGGVGDQEGDRGWEGWDKSPGSRLPEAFLTKGLGGKSFDGSGPGVSERDLARAISGWDEQSSRSSGEEEDSGSEERVFFDKERVFFGKEDIFSEEEKEFFDEEKWLFDKMEPKVGERKPTFDEDELGHDQEERDFSGDEMERGGEGKGWEERQASLRTSRVWEKYRGKDGKLPELKFPPGFDEIMAQMRSVAEESLREKEERHPHLKERNHEDEDGEVEDEEDREMEDEEDGEMEDEEDSSEEDEGDEAETGDGFMDGGRRGFGEDPIADARAEFERMLSSASAAGGLAPADGRVWEEDWDDEDQELNSSKSAVTELSKHRALDPVAPDAMDGREGALMETGSWELEEQQDEAEEQEQEWTPLMHAPIPDRNLVILEVVKSLTEDAMNAARAADEAAGFVEPGKAGPAVQATMHARLRNLAEARFWRKAMAFVDEDYPAEGVAMDVRTAMTVVEMFCKLRGMRVRDAVAFEERCRTEFGLRPSRRILGTILAAWAKRRQLGEMKKTLDLMQRLGVKTRERDLKFVRMLVDKGKFKHEWLPADPMAEVKKVLMAVWFDEIEKDLAREPYTESPELRELRECTEETRDIDESGVEGRRVQQPKRTKREKYHLEGEEPTRQ